MHGFIHTAGVIDESARLFARMTDHLRAALFAPAAAA
jgi:hypothetical protein